MRRIFLLFIFALFLGVLCFGETVVADTPAIDREIRILIASSKSDYKEAVIQQLLENFSALPAEVTRIELKELKKINSSDFDAIVILNKIWAWSMEGKVKKFLKKLDTSEKGKIVLLNTAGDPDYKPKDQDIASITSASSDKDLPATVEKIEFEIRKILFPG